MSACIGFESGEEGLCIDHAEKTKGKKSFGCSFIGYQIAIARSTAQFPNRDHVLLPIFEDTISIRINNSFVAAGFKKSSES